MDNFKTINRLFPWLFLLSVVIFSLTPQAFAESIDDQVRSIAHQLRCPTCQGLSVKESEAGLSENMKSKIRKMLTEGKSEEEILTFFVERYGEWILRSPQKKGFNLLLWLAPVFLILLTAGWLIRSLLKRPQISAQKTASPLSAKEKAAIDKDLEHFELD